MAEEEPGASTGEEQEEEETPAAEAAAGVDPKQDDVKPVIFIGLFIATLFSMGRLVFNSFDFNPTLAGGLELLLNQEENGCAMTYMYEYPQYVPIKMEDKVTTASLTGLLTCTF